MSNAALYFHPDGYDTSGARLMGRHAAGESFLRGLLRHAEVDAFHLWNAANRPIPELEALLRRVEPSARPVKWLPNRRALGQVGVAHLPVPGIDEEAWLRRPFGDAAYAICGITHTTATVVVMRTIAELLLAPLHDYDALICTSSAVRQSVEAELDGVRDYLAAEYGPRRRPEPRRVTIPLGVNTADFAPSEAHRAAWRQRLEIPADAVVALYVGRFNARAKMNPALMALGLERAARSTGRPIYWVNSGWGGGATSDEGVHKLTRALCPSVHYRSLDGRPPDVRFSIWSAADFFISFSDNIQETFGLTPVEAMAAGLPCVVTDWNGYRDTVRDGEDGFRIPTMAPAPGAGLDLAYAFAVHVLNYDDYVGAAGQYTAIDLGAAERAISALALNADLRRRMGQQAKARARALFDWSAIVPQYQALWAEQDARRRAAPPPPHGRENPFRPDPYRLFGGYPTRHLANDWSVAAPPGVAWADAEAILKSPLASYSSYQRPTLAEAAQVFHWLSERGAATVGELLETIPPPRRPFVSRGLLWMARFGAIELTPST